MLGKLVSVLQPGHKALMVLAFEPVAQYFCEVAVVLYRMRKNIGNFVLDEKRIPFPINSATYVETFEMNSFLHPNACPPAQKLLETSNAYPLLLVAVAAIAHILPCLHLAPLSLCLLLPSL